LFLSKVTYPYLNLPPRSIFSAVQETTASWQAI
jgi:hypothetical protein